MVVVGVGSRSRGGSRRGSGRESKEWGASESTCTYIRARDRGPEKRDDGSRRGAADDGRHAAWRGVGVITIKRNNRNMCIYINIEIYR